MKFSVQVIGIWRKADQQMPQLLDDPQPGSFPLLLPLARDHRLCFLPQLLDAPASPVLQGDASAIPGLNRRLAAIPFGDEPADIGERVHVAQAVRADPTARDDSECILLDAHQEKRQPLARPLKLAEQCPLARVETIDAGRLWVKRYRAGIGDNSERAVADEASSTSKAR